VLGLEVRQNVMVKNMWQEGYSPHGRQEIEKEIRRGQEQENPKDLPLMINFLQLGPTSQSS
jgi:hypothetical protein